MSRLTRDGTAEPVSRDQILRRERGQENNVHFPCSADQEEDWQPYPVDPYSATYGWMGGKGKRKGYVLEENSGTSRGLLLVIALL